MENAPVDTTEYPSLARLASVGALLAVQNRRVEAVIDGHLDSVERLFRAATHRDWEAVARLSHELAHQREDAGNKAVVRSARKVSEALRRDPCGTRASRRLAELLSACRSAKAQRR